MRDYKEKYQRKNFVSLCLSDQEMSEVDELTKRLDLTRAAAIRELLLTSTTKLKNRIHIYDDKEQLFLLSNVANNINQVDDVGLNSSRWQIQTGVRYTFN